MRVARHEPLGRPQPGRAERARPTQLGLVRLDAVDPDALGDGFVDGVPRVQRSGRILEDHLHAASQARAASAGAGRPAALERDRSGRRSASQPEDRPDQRRLAASPTLRPAPAPRRARTSSDHAVDGAATAPRRSSRTSTATSRSAQQLVIDPTPRVPTRSAPGDRHVDARRRRVRRRPRGARRRPRARVDGDVRSAGGRCSPVGRLAGSGGSPASPLGVIARRRIADRREGRRPAPRL